MGHHASLPLALAILYQDYPFALADLFLKRALALLAVVTIAFVAVATFGDRSVAFAEFIERDPRQFGLLMTLWVATALLYPTLRAATAWFVDAILLRRPNYRALRATVSGIAQTLDDIPTLLSTVCDLVKPSLSSPRVTWHEADGPRAHEPLGPLVVRSDDGVTRAVVPTGEAPRYAITIAPLTGGRRLLSDDIATLEAIVTIVARRIDAIRMTQERHAREIREREIGRLATEAELRALRAQINPHFLFNALTTIGYLIQTAPPRALQTLLRLTSLLRAVLRSEGEFTTLGRELDVIEAYLDIERARFEQRLRVSIDVPARLRHIRLPPLVLQPLVENAVKHGVAPRAAGGDVTITARSKAMRRARGSWRSASRTPAPACRPRRCSAAASRASGSATSSAASRVSTASASLSIDSAPGSGTRVEVRIPITSSSRDQPAERVAV